GMIPIFWTPLKLPYLKKLFFKDVIIPTVYNAAHLIRRVRELGFEVLSKSSGEGLRLRVYRDFKKGRTEMYGMNYYQTCIQNHLMHEDFIVEIFSKMKKEIEAGKIKPNTHIELRIQQHIGSEDDSA